jgi:membrane-bound lytic murein transglycosylase D
MRGGMVLTARMLIKAGSVLIVPRSSKMHTDVPDEIADGGQLHLQPEAVTRKMTVKAGKKDSVTSIARRYKVNAKQLAEWNGVATTTAFSAGQQVVLYVPVRASGPKAAGKKSGTVRKHAASATKPVKAVKR